MSRLSDNINQAIATRKQYDNGRYATRFRTEALFFMESVHMGKPDSGYEGHIRRHQEKALLHYIDDLAYRDIREKLHHLQQSLRGIDYNIDAEGKIIEILELIKQ
jgi:hypothetical protein